VVEHLPGIGPWVQSPAPQKRKKEKRNKSASSFAPVDGDAYYYGKNKWPWKKRLSLNEYEVIGTILASFDNSQCWQNFKKLPGKILPIIPLNLLGKATLKIWRILYEY
jgi:hypothetical protein